jgi:hypothetical protein
MYQGIDKVRQDELYTATVAEGYFTQEDQPPYVVVEEEKLPRIEDSPSFQRSVSSIQSDAQDTARQEKASVEIITRILRNHQSILCEIKDQIKDALLKDVSLNKFRETRFSEREMIDGFALSFVRMFRTVDVSLSKDLCSALSEQIEVEKNGKRNAIDHLTRQDVYADYRETAWRLSETIISEKHVTDVSKLIKPVELGGVAGGQKFIAKSILLKMSRDIRLTSTRYLYSGVNTPRDDFAMKAAAQELLGASHYYFVLAQMHLPIFPAMQSLVDYKGHRIVALPLLSIDKGTLVYGSADSGQSVKADDAVGEILSETAKLLHIATHSVRGVNLHTAGDVEVHKAHDGRLYLLDMARCFPPEHPRVCKHKLAESWLPSNIFFRMLRPEFLYIWKKHDGEKLSPDACSGWGKEQPENDEVLYKASNFLFEIQVPILVSSLVEKIKSNESSIDLSVMFHMHGVNMRHIGFAVSLIRAKFFEELLPEQQTQFFKLFSGEILYRSLKSMLRNVLRSCPVGFNSQTKRQVANWVSSLIIQLMESSSGMNMLRQTIFESFGKYAFDFLTQKQCYEQWRFELGKIFVRVFHKCGICLAFETEQFWNRVSAFKLSTYSQKKIFLQLNEYEISTMGSRVNSMPMADQSLCTQLQDAIDQAKKSKAADHVFILNKIAHNVALRCLRRFPLRNDLQSLLNKLKLSVLMNDNVSEYLWMIPKCYKDFLI